jgi:dTDP-4-dehydrorhamnose reductase
MNKKILVLGATGMLGHKLVQHLGSEFEIAGTVRTLEPPLYPQLSGTRLYCGVDALSEGSIRGVLETFCPDAVVNCVGLIKQKEESKNPEMAIRVNALLPHTLARLCDAQRAKLVQMSTDCVFSGQAGRPYKESDMPDAIDLYGRTKLSGEVIYAPHLTLRTSIIGPELSGSRSLLEWVISQRGKAINGFTRALYTGLTTLQMARSIARILRVAPDLSGLYHLSAQAISKYDLITLIDKAYGLGIDLHRNEEFFCDRRLDGKTLDALVRLKTPDWPQMIQEMSDDHNQIL